MIQRLCIYFNDNVPLEQLAASMLLARWASEGLHGEVVVRLEAQHHLDARRRACTFDTARPAGHDLARIFLAFVAREFSPGQYRVEHAPVSATSPDAA